MPKFIVEHYGRELREALFDSYIERVNRLAKYHNISMRKAMKHCKPSTQERIAMDEILNTLIGANNEDFLNLPSMGDV